MSGNVREAPYIYIYIYINGASLTFPSAPTRSRPIYAHTHTHTHTHTQTQSSLTMRMQEKQTNEVIIDAMPVDVTQCYVNRHEDDWVRLLLMSSHLLGS
jgi:hypothetical protein